MAESRPAKKPAPFGSVARLIEQHREREAAMTPAQRQSERRVERAYDACWKALSKLDGDELHRVMMMLRGRCAREWEG